MSTLHTTDAQETITRVIDFFPPHEQPQIRLSLAGSLRGIICQRLVPRADGLGRCVAMEVCINTGRVADAIVDPDKTSTIHQLITEGGFYGMQTFDQHLTALFRDGVITLDAAMAASTSPHDLMVELRRLGLVAICPAPGARSASVAVIEVAPRKRSRSTITRRDDDPCSTTAVARRPPGRSAATSNRLEAAVDVARPRLGPRPSARRVEAATCSTSHVGVPTLVAVGSRRRRARHATVAASSQAITRGVGRGRGTSPDAGAIAVSASVTS